MAETIEDDDIPSFADLGLDEEIINALGALQIDTPTRIQQEVIPYALDGRNCTVVAPTGTGKTYAYALPGIQNIVRLYTGKYDKFLVLAPRRALVTQIGEVLAHFTQEFRLRLSVLAGEDRYSTRDEAQSLRFTPQFVVSTPDRLLKHMEYKHVSVQSARMVVLDEADELFGEFRESVTAILAQTPRNKQTLYFSATASPILDAVKLKNSVNITITPETASVAAANIQQSLIHTEYGNKIAVLQRVLDLLNGQVIVFCNGIKATVNVARALRQGRHAAAPLHSHLDREERSQTVENFRAGRIRILVATSAVERGFDMPDLAVILYDVPRQPEEYIHRIGRSGRAGKQGFATMLVTAEDERLVHNIQEYLGQDIPRTTL